jgi:homoserine dehydrogenase
VLTSGIRRITAEDIREAQALGYRVRLVGIAEAHDDALFQRVSPCLVPRNHPLAHVAGSLNAIVAEGNFVGRLFFEGAGAGAGPTASAVVADLIDVARGEFGPAFAMPFARLANCGPIDPGSRRSRVYLRFAVHDRPGVLAEITAAMRDANVSIESMIQRGGADPSEDSDDVVNLIIVTHDAPEHRVAAALASLQGSASLAEEPMLMHILDL